jgi:3-oxoacyl-[acyl-carrier-protein] synthase-1/3-oxoacyl-[acyl-carrier-protein] synthase II
VTAVIAMGAASGLGRGQDAVAAGPPGEPAPTAIAEDAALAEAGLRRPRASRAVAVPKRFEDRATDLLVDALEQTASELDEARPGWRDERLGVCIGTSSGGMLGAEKLFAALADGGAPDDAAAATYFAPFGEALRATELAPIKRCQVVAACASSTIAIGMGMRWLARDACDLVLAGGYDGVSLFVAAGFEALRATSASMPKPFKLERDGMLLGEGAGIVALCREPVPAARFFVTGFGASADAVHITAPDREGGGLIRAGRAALADARCDAGRIDLVSAHGTSTPYNDAAEAKAVQALCDDPIVHPFKAQIGHTLGAAGVLELLSAAHALNTQVAPACFGEGTPDPEAHVRLLERAEPRKLDAALKLSAAFGGVTAALVAEREQADSGARRPARAVRVVGHAAVNDVDRVALAEVTNIPREKLARIDDLGQLALAAVAALAEGVGRPAFEGAGVVGGYSLATLDTNRRFNERLLKKGPRWVDPRLFPATSPNAGAGHCAIAYGLTGPCFAVNGGLAGSIEALAAGAELIASGDVDRMVIVAADDDGETARAWYAAEHTDRPHARGAVAALLTFYDPDAPAPAAGRRVDLDMPIPHETGPVGHLALLEWLRSPA